VYEYTYWYICSPSMETRGKRDVNDGKGCGYAMVRGMSKPIIDRTNGHRSQGKKCFGTGCNNRMRLHPGNVMLADNDRQFMWHLEDKVFSSGILSGCKARPTPSNRHRWAMAEADRHNNPQNYENDSSMSNRRNPHEFYKLENTPTPEENIENQRSMSNCSNASEERTDSFEETPPAQEGNRVEKVSKATPGFGTFARNTDGTFTFNEVKQ
jgi:hypothetical protein